MKLYRVRLTADAIVSATVVLKAEDEEDARKMALAQGDDETLYQVDSLHDAATVFGVEVIAHD